MSTTLTEFLREKAAEESAQRQKREEQIAEWRQAVERLLAKLQEWVRTADPDGLLEVKRNDFRINEEGLGKYQVPGLVITAFDRQMMVVPKARYTVATATLPQNATQERASGRVDLTDDARRFVLYRFRREKDDIWMIDDTTANPRLFDQAEFESALLSFLK